MKKEEYILKKVGRENHFSVPEGYFQNLTAEVMSKIPESPENRNKKIVIVPLWKKLTPWVSLAAVLIGVVCVGGIKIFNNNKSVRPVTVSTSNNVISDEYINDALDHSMTDDYSFYELLSDKNENQ
jgi:hypothetical protein